MFLGVRPLHPVLPVFLDDGTVLSKGGGVSPYLRIPPLFVVVASPEKISFVYPERKLWYFCVPVALMDCPVGPDLETKRSKPT